jgi:hypothetical protein
MTRANPNIPAFEKAVVKPLPPLLRRCAHCMNASKTASHNGAWNLN